MNIITSPGSFDSGWNSLYRIGGAAALIAGVFFRRNIAAEIGLFFPTSSPSTLEDWFVLLQDNRLLGLTYLNIFDLVNYALVGLMFLALYVVLTQTNKSGMAIAAIFSFLGIAVYFASNTAFSMLSLSDQYYAVTTEAERSALLAAGQAMLAVNRFSDPGSNPGTGGYISLLFIATAGIITSVIMLRSTLFNRTTAYLGLLANAFDLAYCFGFAFVPTADSKLLAVIFIPAAGLFFMLWHILTG
jgi:hypothetical protein